MRLRSTLLFAITLILNLAYTTGARSEPPGGRYIIAFKAHPGAAEEAMIRSLGGEVHHRYSIVPAIAATLPGAAVTALQNNPRVLRIEVDVKAEAIDAELDAAWGVKRIGTETVHAGGNKGAGVKVAVIDTGADMFHSDLLIAGGHDFVNRDANPQDDNGHGTHVAGTVAGRDNGSGVVGVAPDAEVYALKVLDAGGAGYFSDIIAAVEWCVSNGIQVTNNSYGSSSYPGVTVEQAFANADAAGILNIAAAGNAGNRRGNGDNIIYPAGFASVVAVTATDASDQRASFSSTGAAAEIAAPGVRIRSTWPGGGYRDLDGTSMASPHVAGAAAAVLAAGISDAGGDGRVNDDVRARLSATAHDLGHAGWDPHYGAGLVDVAAAVAGTDGGTGGEPTGPPVSGALLMALSTDKAVYGNGESVSITASIEDEGGFPVAGATVDIAIDSPNGRRFSGSGTTDAGGKVVFRHKANVKRDGAGTYQITGSASKQGYTGGAAAGSFEVF